MFGLAVSLGRASAGEAVDPALATAEVAAAAAAGQQRSEDMFGSKNSAALVVECYSGDSPVVLGRPCSPLCWLVPLVGRASGKDLATLS